MPGSYALGVSFSLGTGFSTGPDFLQIFGFVSAFSGNEDLGRRFVNGKRFHFPLIEGGCFLQLLYGWELGLFTTLGSWLPVCENTSRLKYVNDQIPCPADLPGYGFDTLAAFVKRNYPIFLFIA